MWTYAQKAGGLFHDNMHVGDGYSGHDHGLNNPMLEAWHDVGPIPSGQWHIEEWFDSYPGKGPCVAKLIPVDHDAHGRSGFLIHGDNSAGDHSASHGCIILGPSIRKAMRDSGDKALTVISGI